MLDPLIMKLFAYARLIRIDKPVGFFFTALANVVGALDGEQRIA